MSHFKQLITLAGGGNYPLAKGIVTYLGEHGIDCLKSHINHKLYVDGEPNDVIVLRDEIPGSDVLIFQSMSTVKLKNRFLDIAGACMRQYGARSVTAILPFMFARRQDHPNESKGEIDRNILLISDIAVRRVRRVVLCDIHSQITIDNFEREGVRVWNVEQVDIFAPSLRQHVVQAQ